MEGPEVSNAYPAADSRLWSTEDSIRDSRRILAETERRLEASRQTLQASFRRLAASFENWGDTPISADGLCPDHQWDDAKTSARVAEYEAA